MLARFLAGRGCNLRDPLKNAGNREPVARGEKLQTSERSPLLHNLLFKTILRALDLDQPSLRFIWATFPSRMTRLRFSCITASTDVMQKLYLEIDSPYKASRAFNKYALNLAPLYSLSYLNFSCCEGIHIQ